MLCLWLVLPALAGLPQGFGGAWQLADGAGREPAIDTLVQEMAFWKRPIARSRLFAVTAPCGELAFWSEGDQVGIRCDALPVTVDRPDSTAIRWLDAQGQVYDLSIEVRDDVVIQTFSAPEGGRRTNTYTVAQGSMQVEVVMTSPLLPRPLHYVDRYRPGR